MAENKFSPEYGQFFSYAFSFTIMHVVALVVATIPTDVPGHEFIVILYIAGGHHRALGPLEENAMSVSDKLVTWARRKSPWIIHFNTGSCNACDIEVVAATTPRFDLERFGVMLKGSPRHADILICSGPVTRQIEDRLKLIYDQMAEPKYVIAVGTCACSGGIFRGCYNVKGGIDFGDPRLGLHPGLPGEARGHHRRRLEAPREPGAGRGGGAMSDLEREEGLVPRASSRAFPFLEGAASSRNANAGSASRVELPRFREVFDRAVDGMGFSILCIVTGLDEGRELRPPLPRRAGGRHGPVHPHADSQGGGLTCSRSRTAFPSAHIYERELEDLFGIEVDGLPPGNRYPLPDGWPEGQYPLRKDWKAPEASDVDR